MEVGAAEAVVMPSSVVGPDVEDVVDAEEDADVAVDAGVVSGTAPLALLLSMPGVSA